MAWATGGQQVEARARWLAQPSGGAAARQISAEGLTILDFVTTIIYLTSSACSRQGHHHLLAKMRRQQPSPVAVVPSSKLAPRLLPPRAALLVSDIATRDEALVNEIRTSK